jgi:hypothetical protein
LTGWTFHNATVTSVAFNEKGTQLLSGSLDQDFTIFNDMAKFDQDKQDRISSSSRPPSFLFSPSLVSPFSFSSSFVFVSQWLTLLVSSTSPSGMTRPSSRRERIDASKSGATPLLTPRPRNKTSFKRHRLLALSSSPW